jgi:hypothetical protein
VVELSHRRHTAGVCALLAFPQPFFNGNGEKRMKKSLVLIAVLMIVTLTNLYVGGSQNSSVAEAQTATSSSPMSLDCITLTEEYKSSADLARPAGATAVFGTCGTAGPVIIGDKSHNKYSFLVATEDSEVMDATGLHCESKLGAVAQVRCCSAN